MPPQSHIFINLSLSSNFSPQFYVFHVPFLYTTFILTLVGLFLPNIGWGSGRFRPPPHPNISRDNAHTRFCNPCFWTNSLSPIQWKRGVAETSTRAPRSLGGLHDSRCITNFKVKFEALPIIRNKKYKLIINLGI